MTEALSLSKVHRSGPGWYRGDFHCHTHHSDGGLAPPDLLALARKEGLDFFAITDHNTVDAYTRFGDEGGLLIIPGVEVTYKEGHFNAFGLSEGADWIERLRAGAAWRQARLGGDYPTMTDVMRAHAERGWLNSINHPLLKPWEWREGDTDLHLVNCLEVWNDPSWPDNQRDNPRAVGLWKALLEEGYRITAIGGSDFHNPKPGPKEPPGKPAERLGVPSTYVYADELSGAAVLAGVRAGRVWVSMGPRAAFTARTGEREHGIGADLGEFSGEVTLQAEIKGSERPGRARLVRGGSAADALEAALDNGARALEWRAQVRASEWGWFHFEAWDEAGQMLALTNPIYFGPRREPQRRRFGEFVPELG